MISDFDLEGKNKLQKAAYYLKNYGAPYTVKKALRKLGVPFREESEYMAWCRRNAASKNERRGHAQLCRIGSFAVVFEQGTDMGRAGFKSQSVNNLSYIAIDGGTAVLDLLRQSDAEAFVFCGRSARVLPEYLYETAKAFTQDIEPVSRIRQKNEKPVDLVYTDEDNCAGKKRRRPFFKPDADIQLLLNFQYLGEVFAVRRSLLKKVAGSGEDVRLCGNGWYDLALQAFRCAEHICHIPKVLFSNLTSKEEAGLFARSRLTDGAGCLKRYLKAEHIAADIIKSDVPGFFHVRVRLAKEPLVSIIIPNKDHIEDLGLCLTSLAEQSDYTNYEVIIAENNSTDPETFAYYEKLQKEDGRISVVVWEGEFNYSAINNFAVKHARGELFLFLNNDTEFMDAQSLRELVVSVLKPGVGACGAMLYYGDRTIQHAGVIIGMGGFAAHALWSLSDRDETYYPFSLCERRVSAVTGACLMVRRSVFEETGGMEEDFAVALNDVDFCMKVRAAGYHILFNPYARLYHYESKSRGYEDTVQKQARFQKEINRFQQKWETEILNGDPYYNPNLTLHRADYSMDI